MALAICWAKLASWLCVIGGKAKEKLYKKINIIDFYWISWYKTANKFQNKLYYGFLLSICLFSFECFFHVHASILMVMIINFYSFRSLTGHTFISSVSSFSSILSVHFARYVAGIKTQLPHRIQWAIYPLHLTPLYIILSPSLFLVRYLMLWSMPLSIKLILSVYLWFDFNCF